ncbi:MAG: hypothetical protein K8T91_06325 [Planctomycetes bacterium]|nr:hypothetical protein [Planctomycetota bacterium]
MTMLEAIELIKSKQAGEVSAEQLAGLRAILEKTPSLYSMLGGRPAVDAFIQTAEAALKSGGGVAVAVEPNTRSAGGPQVSSGPPPLPFWAAWSRRRLIEVGIFAALIVVFGVGFVVVLLSMLGSGNPSKNAAKKQATEQVTENQGDTTAKAQPDAGGAPPSHKDQTLVEEPSDIWHGWKFTKVGAARADKSAGWDLENPSKPRPIYRLLSAGGGLSFDRQQTIPANTGSMRIECVQTVVAPAGTIELIIDGKPSGKTNVPAPGTSEPILLPLTLTPGQQATLKIVYTPGGPDETVEWRGLRLSDERVEVLAPSGELDAARPSLRLWLRADRGIKDAAGRGPLDAGFDGQVKTWEDQASHKFHFIQSTGAAPKFEPTNPMLSGKSGVLFGGGAYLTHSGHSLYDTPASTTFIVFTVQGLARKQRERTSAVAESSPPSFGWRTGAHHDRRGRYGHDVTFVGPTSSMVSKIVPMGSYALIAAARVNDRDSFIEINGRNRMFVEATGMPSGDNFILGGSSATPGSYGGTIAELIIYNRGLSAVEVRQVGKYLQARFGIAGDY